MTQFRGTTSAWSRALLVAGSVAALVTLGPAGAADKTVKIGMSLPLTGADAEDATLSRTARCWRSRTPTPKAASPATSSKSVIYDSGTATAGQYDPAQAATNTEEVRRRPAGGRHVGPQMSGEGKAMSPILSEADLATITPSSTNPDITDPKMAAQFRPKGKAIYFRTVTTDAYQGPNMANYVAREPEGRNRSTCSTIAVPMAWASPTPSRSRPRRSASRSLGRDQLNPEGSRLHDDPDQDQGAEPRRAVLRRRGPGRRQARQAGL